MAALEGNDVFLPDCGLNTDQTSLSQSDNASLIAAYTYSLFYFRVLFDRYPARRTNVNALRRSVLWHVFFCFPAISFFWCDWTV